MISLDYNVCLPVEFQYHTASCSVSLQELALRPPYRSLGESISLLQTTSLCEGLAISIWLPTNPPPSPFLLHQAPIVHSGHSLLLHFTWRHSSCGAERVSLKAPVLLVLTWFYQSLSETNSRAWATVNRQRSKHTLMFCDNKWQFPLFICTAGMWRG